MVSRERCNGRGAGSLTQGPLSDPAKCADSQQAPKKGPWAAKLLPLGEVGSRDLWCAVWLYWCTWP
eukprot:4943113-Prymnesium_polylepis.1